MKFFELVVFDLMGNCINENKCCFFILYYVFMDKVYKYKVYFEKIV